MRQRSLLALALVTVLVLAAAVFVPRASGPKPPPVLSGPVFPTFKDWSATATRLVIVGPDGTVTLERRDAAAAKDEAGKEPVEAKPPETWTLVDKSGFPAQPAPVQQLLSGLGALRYLEPKTRKPDLFPRLEVEEPGKPGAKSRSVELLDGNGARIAALIVGKKRYDRAGGNRDAVYVRLPEEAQSWAAEPALTVSSDWLSWVDRRVLDVDPDRLQSVALLGADGQRLTASRAKPEDKLAIDAPPPNVKFKSDTPLAAVANSLRGMEFGDVRPVGEIAGTPAGTVRLVTFDGLSVGLTLAEQDGGTWVKLSATGTGDGAKQADELVARTRNWSYRLSPGVATALKTRLPDLVEPAKPS